MTEGARERCACFRGNRAEHTTGNKEGDELEETEKGLGRPVVQVRSQGVAVQVPRNRWLWSRCVQAVLKIFEKSAGGLHGFRLVSIIIFKYVLWTVRIGLYPPVFKVFVWSSWFIVIVEIIANRFARTFVIMAISCVEDDSHINYWVLELRSRRFEESFFE